MNILSNRIHIALQLSLSDWMDLVKAWIVLLGYKFPLYWKNFDSFAALNSQFRENNEIPIELEKYLHHQFQLVHWASRLHFTPMGCLEKSLTLQWILARKKINAQLRIGAEKTQTGLKTHAWVELNGVPIGESSSIISRFSLLNSNDNSIF